MRKVNKGKLAGKAFESLDSLGFSSLSKIAAISLSKSLAEKTADACCVVNSEGRIVVCSESLAGRSGLDAGALVGQAMLEVCHGDDDQLRLSTAMVDARTGGDALVALRLKSGKARALPARATLSTFESGPETLLLIQFDFWSSEFGRQDFQVGGEHLDASTGILGRLGFLDMAGKAYLNDGFKDRPCVVCVDVSGMGAINERLGMEGGDDLLRQMAERIKGQARRGDLAGRIGGDRFALYASFAGNPSDAQAVCARATAALSAPYECSGQHLSIGFKLGAALGPKDGSKIHELMSHAEMAAKSAKGQSVPLVFYADMPR